METKGVAFVEFALLSPVLVLLLLAGFDLILYNNAKAVTQNVNSSLSRVSYYLSEKYGDDLGEIGFGRTLGQSQWHTPSPRDTLRSYVSTTLEPYISDLAIPLSVCRYNTACTDSKINIVYTAFFCPLGTRQTSYRTRTYFFAGKASNLGGSNSAANTILRQTVPHLRVSSLFSWGNNVNCADIGGRNYFRILTNYNFTSPFSSLFQMQINELTMGRLSTESVNTYANMKTIPSR